MKLDDENVTKFLKIVLKYFPKCLYTVDSTQTSRCSLYKKKNYLFLHCAAGSMFSLEDNLTVLSQHDVFLSPLSHMLDL